jgi:DNA polymerase III delta prime subunit
MTIQVNDDQFLWTERYRPQTVDECILPTAIKNTFKEYIRKGELPTFLLDGTAGVGKTTIAKALCKEIGAEYLFINGSDEGRSIDTLRTTIRGFASSVSLYDSPKVVIIDEADYMNAQSVQPALRSFIEEYSSNCRFIFTCNYKNRIIEPLRSRCTVVDFRLDNKDKADMAGQFFKRATQILKMENIEFDSKVVAEIITKYFPDYRKVLSELQRYSVSGKIDSGILVNLSEESYKELFKMMKDRDFKNVRTWVGKNSDTDVTRLFRQFYDNAINILEPSSIPTLILLLSEYQYKAAFVADSELNVMACMVEVMGNCKFK